MTRRHPRVVIVQERLPHYRVPFFKGLRDHLAREEIELQVLHGHSHGVVAARHDEGHLDWAQVVTNRIFTARGVSLVHQPVLRRTSSADLVVVEQASRMLVNYLLLVRQGFSGAPVAFWGHGGGLPGSGLMRTRASETVKSHVSRLPQWWFAYTEGSARRVERLGFDPRRITVVQNSVDTSFMKTVSADRNSARCIYVGSLDERKRLDLVFQAADELAARRADFHLVVVGDGPLRPQVSSMAGARTHVSYVGPRFGEDLARELKSASVMLMPGAVGLGVLDAFAAGLPVVTANGPGHGPELEYLREGWNAAIVEATPRSLAAATADLMDPTRRVQLERACAETSERISMEEMVARFASGVTQALRLRAARTAENRTESVAG